MHKITVVSQCVFDEMMAKRNLDDSNVDEIKDEAFISIIGTKECLEHYLHEPDTVHWFKDGHDNVLNLDFDDIAEDIVHDGHTYKAMSNEQAEKAVEFIERNIGKDFTIHCRAGMSRSQGVGCFIHDMYEGYSDESLLRDFANKGVIMRLKHVLNNRNYGNLME